ncbi:sigma-w pathway protein ysdB [Peribacillus asahii]|uniref:Sigma-w pathway protein ysdB n=1 Tax=Peribacillus asahii TaxID=228899 RepID=A0A398B8W0_9BACI|nr:sigma-w pathway protein ysdB [Peribacillus asahii]RID86415.1 sigma-w pathway protein ysdB [Peribacillus asahii]
MALLFRLILLVVIVFSLYTAIKYMLSPRRKLELAHEQGKFYFLDDPKNIRKNFLLTYNGVLFEGEKYLGTTERSFEVVSIFIWPKNTADLKGLKRDDFLKIEAAIKKHYPASSIDWKSPVKEFLNRD